MRVTIVLVSLFALVIVCVAQDKKACFSAMNGLKDGCDDTKLADIKTKCGDKMKDVTCESIAQHREQMKGCMEAGKAAAAACDDAALVKVKAACPKKEGMPEVTCEMIKKMAARFAKKGQ